MSDIVGSIPEFTTDESVETGVEEVKQPATDEVVGETETPTELPAETKKPVPTKVEDDDTEAEVPLEKHIERATQGLRNEVVELRQKLAQATGNDRKLIKQDIITAQEKIDELADVNPADVSLIEKVLKSKGYMTKQEAMQITKSTVQTQVLNEFLDKYPEYKPENDPNDINWKALQRELSFYRDQDDPTKIKEILERSHKAIHPNISDLKIPQKKRAIQVASAGAGGVQRSSSSKTLDPNYRRILEDGGFTEEEIANAEKRLE